MFYFEDQVVDPGRRELTRAGVSIDLEPRIFDLLLYLLRANGRLVTKDDLITHVWSGRIVSDSALTSAINGVRKALGDSGEQQRLLRTVPKKGFRFIAPVEPGGKSEADTLPLPEKPSVAVLPFLNLSNDPNLEYFADGIVEDITTALSQTKQLFVIARNSSFSYKGKSPDIRLLGRELGVRYVLEGSVRKAGDRVRITGQLVEAANGAHIWADRFDGRLEDVFDLQDRVTSHVVTAIMPTVEHAEVERVRRSPTASLAAYDHLLRGRERFTRYTSEDTDQALQHFNRAIEADPLFAQAYGHAAVCYAQRKAWGWQNSDRERDTIRAERLARRALELDSSHPKVLAMAGWVIALVCERVEDGHALIARSVDLDPNLFVAWNYLGWCSWALGNGDALGHFEHALRLNPRDPNVFGIQSGLAAAHFENGRYEEAARWTAKVLAGHPRQMTALWFSTASLGLLGRPEEARAACRIIREIIPTVSLSTLRRWLPVQRDEQLASLREGLRLAGMPE